MTIIGETNTEDAAWRRAMGGIVSQPGLMLLPYVCRDHGARHNKEAKGVLRWLGAAGVDMNLSH